MLTKPQFSVLESCRRNPGASQRAIARDTGLSLGTVNAALRDLRNGGGLLDEGNALTPAGLEALAPYRVDNAIIMAAGLSSRFAPISFEKPKGVLNVRGEVLVERQIRQLQEAGITDITVVVGYKKEEFFYLEDLFGVDIVVNPFFASRNNNSTIRMVQERLGNTFICSSDDYFTQNPFEPYVYESYYSAVFEKGATPEYCITTRGKDRRIVDVTIGGEDSWVMLGHVYWDRSFSQTFCHILDEVYDSPDTVTKLWEDIYIEHMRELPMVMRPYDDGVIWEFDSLDELKVFDPHFIENVDSSIMDNICQVLGCERSDIVNIVPIKQGITNLSCRFEVAGQLYVYRHPGNGTDEIINRASEAASNRIARDLGIDTTFVYEDDDLGWKISRFVDGCTELDYEDSAQVAEAMRLARRLHDADVHSDFSFDLREEALKIEELLRRSNEKPAFKDYHELRDTAMRAYELARASSARECLCHNDFYAPNFLVTDAGMELIDWEYSGMSDYASDLGTFICCAPSYGYDDAVATLEAYFERPLEHGELVHCMGYIAMASFYWFIWALYKDACEEPVGDYLRLWYRNAKLYGAKTLQLAGEQDEPLAR